MNLRMDEMAILKEELNHQKGQIESRERELQKLEEENRLLEDRMRERDLLVDKVLVAISTTVQQQTLNINVCRGSHLQKRQSVMHWSTFIKE